MVAAADLGKQLRAGRQGQAQQLTGIFAIERDLEDAAGRDFGLGPRRLARQPQQLGDGVAQRPDGGHPVAKRLGAHRERLIQPVAVVGQVELAGAARDGAAMLDRVQEFRIAQTAA